MNATRFSRFALWILLAAALLVRYRGIDWPTFHPDEPTIATWINESASDGVVRHFGYPSGFFNLIHPVRAAVVAWHERGQDWQYWRGGLDRRSPGSVSNVDLARTFNVWLATLTVLLLYGLARQVTQSSGAALLAAGLLAFAQIHVEHSHYGETDMAMLMLLVLAFLLWARYLAHPRWPWLLLAGLATGLALGTKYTVAPLLLLPLVAVAQRIERPALLRSGARALALLLLALGAAAAGYIWANPGVLEWEWFRSSMREGAERTFAERTGLLQDLRNTWWAAPLANARNGLSNALTLGPGWLLLAALGLPLALRRPVRAHWPITLGFPLLFAIYFVGFAPWVRAQEFMCFLPALCVLAALPLAAVLRPARLAGPRLAAARAALAALALWAFAGDAARGIRASTIFQWKEPRVAAREWLQRHAPGDSVLGFERYAHYAIYDYPGTVVDAFKIERRGLARLRDEGGCDYILRNVSSRGRGTIDPRTNARRPEYQALFDEFMANSELLAQWGSLPPHIPMFAGHVLELYGIGREATATSLPVRLPRPAYLSASLRETAFTPALPVGSEPCLLVGPATRRLALGGPAALREPVYAVLTTEDRAARVTVRGLGRRVTVDLAPYDVAVVRLQRPWWRPSWDAYEFIRAKAHTRRGIVHIPCYLRVAFSEADALRLCNELGRPDRALAILGRDAVRRSEDPAQAFIAAAEAGDTALAGDLAPAARDVLDDLERADAQAVSVEGLGPGRYQEFARVRLDGAPFASFTVGVRDPDVDPPPGDLDWRRDAYSVDATWLPLLLAAGRYEFSCDLSATAVSNAAEALQGPFTIQDLRGQTVYAGDWSAFAHPSAPLTLALDVRHTQRPGLKFVSRVPARVTLNAAQVTWQRRDLLAALRSRLAEGLARDALAHDRQAEAKEYLARANGLAWSEPTRRLLAFRAEREAPAIDYERVRTAARDLVDVAPAHFAARELLQVTESAHLYSTRHRQAGDHTPVPFAPFATLVNTVVTGGFVRCVLEINQDDTPPLALVLARRHRSRWKDVSVKPVGSRLAYHEGERVVVDLPVPARSDAAELAIGLRTRVRWSPGWLPTAGFPDGRVPLPALLVQPEGDTAAR